MKYKIVYDSPGRLRLRCGGGVFSKNQERSLASELLGIDGVLSAEVSAVNGGMLVYYSSDARGDILDRVSAINVRNLSELPPDTGQIINGEFKRDLSKILVKRMLAKIFVKASFCRYQSAAVCKRRP